MPDTHPYATGHLHLSKELTVSFDRIQKVEEYPVEEMEKEGQDYQR